MTRAKQLYIRIGSLRPQTTRKNVLADLAHAKIEVYDFDEDKFVHFTDREKAEAAIKEGINLRRGLKRKMP